MRDLEFRAFDKRANKMFSALISINFDGIAHSCTFISNIGDEETVSISDLELMQFTGLLDRNGKKIFEGDIIQSSFGIPPQYINGLVEFEDGSFIIKTPKFNPKQVTVAQFANYLGVVYIIGNKFENPELLED